MSCKLKTQKRILVEADDEEKMSINVLLSVFI